MRVIIYWSKSIIPGNHINEFLDQIRPKPSCLLIGSIDGIANQIEAWAEDNDVPIERYLVSQYFDHGGQAIDMRNRHLVQSADILLVLWNGRDDACRNIIHMANQYGLKCFQFDPLADKKKLSLVKVPKITIKEIMALKEVALKASGTIMSVHPHVILSLIDAIERRDYVLKKMNERRK